MTKMLKKMVLGFSFVGASSIMAQSIPDIMPFPLDRYAVVSIFPADSSMPSYGYFLSEGEFTLRLLDIEIFPRLAVFVDMINNHKFNCSEAISDAPIAGGGEFTDPRAYSRTLSSGSANSDMEMPSIMPPFESVISTWDCRLRHSFMRARIEIYEPLVAIEDGGASR